MKLKDLIEALAAEIDTIRPELEEQLDELSTLSLDDPNFADQLDAYSMQMQLMGEAAGFAGFAGLEAVSVHMLNNIMLLPTQQPEEREDLVNFLRSWPSLMVHYLHNLDDPSTAAGLVDLLRVAPYPVDEHEAMRLMHQFGSLPGEIEEEEQAERQQRQTIATDDDVALVIPEDVDQKLMEGFFQEAPTQASYNLELIQNLTTEEGDISDIVAAKRSVHSLKGSSAIIGLKGITSLSHHFEDILEHFESKEGDVSKDVAEILLDGAYCLEQMVGYVCGNDDYPDQSKVVLQKILDLAQSIDAKDPAVDSADEGQIHHVSKEMVQALVEEVETVQPELTEQLDQLAGLSIEDESFLEAMEGYTIQVKNMGEAAGYAGFEGLQSASMHITNNAMLLATAEGDERETLLSFLQGWPDWIIHYLKNLDDPSVAAGLVDTLRVAPYPVDEHEALRMMHQFGGLSESGEASPVLEFATEATPASAPETKAVKITAEDVALDVPEDVNAKLMEGFLQEGPEQAGYLLELIRNLASENGDISDITAAKRSAHSLKGSSATIGLRGIALLSHRFEDILEHFESNEGQVSPQVVDTLVDGAYCLEQMVGYVAGTDDYPEQSQAILQKIVDLAAKIDSGEAIVELTDHDNDLNDNIASDADVISVIEDVKTSAAESETQIVNVASPAVSTAAAPEKSVASKADAAKTTEAPNQVAKPAARQATSAAPKAALRVGMDSIEELFRVSAEVSVHSGALEAKTKLLRDYSRDLLSQNIRLKQRLFELETLVDVRAVPLMKPAAREGMQAAFDPLEMDQYNELHSTVHALVEEVNDTIAYSQNIEEEIAQLTGMNSRQQILAGDLQHLVTGTRMAEVGTLESRLQRNIRTTAQATNKSAQLVLKGADTLIDTDVLNRLAEPLLHLLRNAVDHGIESPETRQSLGKPAEGTVTLDFLRQGQQVVLRCSDDGKGLDPAAILSRAKSRGLVSDDAVLGDEDIIRLILTPGFSTRDEVSEVSGRGVGMDVVSEWVQNMNGTIDVRSELGVGSVIELRFAASLTTAHSLIVSIENYYFALPSVQVAQGVARGDGEFMIENNELLYKLNDDVMPARFLSTLVGLSTEDDKSLESYDAVIVNVLNQRYALAVDELVDSRQLLVKTQNRYLQHVRGMAGTSILGDGGIAVHLDMPQLLGVREATGTLKVSSASSAPKVVSNVPRVLIVDDSLSVRNTLQELVSDLGLQTQTARDGLEAVSAIDAFNPTLVLTDLEMPNMNGVELTTHIRGRQDIGKVPIIMITSRSLDKHRKLAAEAGVDAYVTKPYNEAALIKMINETIGR